MKRQKCEETPSEAKNYYMYEQEAKLKQNRKSKIDCKLPDDDDEVGADNSFVKVPASAFTVIVGPYTIDNLRDKMYPRIVT